jgi:hypothetical protein
MTGKGCSPPGRHRTAPANVQTRKPDTTHASHTRRLILFLPLHFTRLFSSHFSAFTIQRLTWYIQNTETYMQDDERDISAAHAQRYLSIIRDIFAIFPRRYLIHLLVVRHAILPIRCITIKYITNTHRAINNTTTTTDTHHTMFIHNSSSSRFLTPYINNITVISHVTNNVTKSHIRHHTLQCLPQCHIQQCSSPQLPSRENTETSTSTHTSFITENISSFNTMTPT